MSSTLYQTALHCTVLNGGVRERTPGNKRLSKEKRCCLWYSSGGNRALG